MNISLAWLRERATVLPLHQVCAQGLLPFWSICLNPFAHSFDVVAFLLSERSKEQFCFYSFQLQGKATFALFALALRKPGRFSGEEAAIFCLKEIIPILGRFLSVTQSILNLISLGICCSPWPQTEFLCLAAHEMSTFIREQALRET